MRDVTTRELSPAVTVLQLFLSSSKPVLRFAAVRTLNKVRRRRGPAGACLRAPLHRAAPASSHAGRHATVCLSASPYLPTLCVPRRWPCPHPMAVTSCNIDMESLIADPNRSIATLVRGARPTVAAGAGGHWQAGSPALEAPCRAHSPLLTAVPPCSPRARQAITTLLKTGNESSIDRLLKQIGGFMSEIADEFKVVVVEAIKALCLKFPQVRRRAGGGGRACHTGRLAPTCRLPFRQPPGPPPDPFSLPEQP